MTPSALVRALGWRYLLATTLISGLVALVVGIPTDVLPNPWFTRMTPVRTSDLILWPLTSVSSGALLATFAASTPSGVPTLGLGTSALGWFAVGCPVCNKLVVALLGFSGALTVFGPLQPFLGGAAVLAACAGLVLRLRGITRGCRLPATALAEPG